MFNSIIQAPQNVVLPTRAGTFPEAAYIEEQRRKAKEYLGARNVLKGGEYVPVNGANPPFIGQKQ